MREGGDVPHVTWNAYKAPAAPEITEKYFGEDKRAHEKMIKDHEAKEAAIRARLDASWGGHDAEINDPPEGLRGTIGKPVNLSESLQEQIARLRNHLTETQIRVTIRQVLKKRGVT